MHAFQARTVDEAAMNEHDVDRMCVAHLVVLS